MDHGVFHTTAMNDQTVFYKRSVYSIRGKFSMTESEIRKELNSTIEKIDPVKDDTRRHKRNVAAAFGIWRTKYRIGIIAVFLMYFFLAVPCTYHLFKKSMLHSQRSKKINNIVQSLGIHDTSMLIVQKLECIVCYRVLSDWTQCEDLCRNEYQSDAIENDCIKDSVSKQLLKLEESIEKHHFMNDVLFYQVLHSVKRCLHLLSSLLLSGDHSDFGINLVEAVKTIDSSYLMIRNCFVVAMACSNNFSQIDVATSIHYFNIVIGNLRSLFVSTNHTNSLKKVYETRFLLYSVSSTILENSKNIEQVDAFCSNNVTLFIHIPMNVMLKGKLSLKKLLTKAQMRIQVLNIEIVSYSLIFFGLFLVSFLVFFQLKTVLLQMVGLKYDNQVINCFLKSEMNEFREVMSELVPSSKFRDALPSEDLADIKQISKYGSQSPHDRGNKYQDIFCSDLCSSEGDLFEPHAVMNKSWSSVTLRKRNTRARMCTIDEENDYNFPKVFCKKKDSYYMQEVTVFQSEIAGFNCMIQHISPQQLINLVSYLIKLFDERICLYDVFIINRHMGSYTVISGISTEQESRHASEIINMALDIRGVCGDLEFERGIQDSKLRLKIGIHTDTCYERLGIYPKPRYRISGEILQVVRKLKSSAPPSGIHVSEATHMLLSRNVNYNLQKYSTLTCSGQKSIRTYVVIGRRVSEDIQPMECPGRRHLWTPIQLEQKALYRFESEEMKYIPPPSWMLPSTSNQYTSGFQSTTLTRNTFISENTGRHQPYISHEVIDYNSD